MWFDNPYDYYLPTRGVPLLGISCVALVAVINFWLVCGRANWIFRCGVSLLIALGLARLPAPELLIFVEAHQLAVLIACFVKDRLARDAKTINIHRDEMVGLFLLLWVETAFGALSAETLYPWHWFFLGLGAGAAAVIVSLGVWARRWWLLTALLTGAIALAVDFAIAASAGRADLFGFEFWTDGSYSPGPDAFARNARDVLTSGTLVYWLWLTTTRVLVGRVAREQAEPARPKRRRMYAAVRYGLFGPLWAAFSIFIFTPWIDAWRRLPEIPAVPVVDDGPNDYPKLLAWADRIDLSSLHIESPEEGEDAAQAFVESNQEAFDALEGLLNGRFRPTIRCRPLMFRIDAAQKDSLSRLLGACKVYDDVTAIHLQLRDIYQHARCDLLLGRAFRRGGATPHYNLGRQFEEQGMALAYAFRLGLAPRECLDLIAMARENARHEEPPEIVFEREQDSMLIVRGWRERVHRACEFPLEVGWLQRDHRSHEALRATFICEMALWACAVEKQRAVTTLDELVPDYLDAVPVDPFSGDPLRYETHGDSPFMRFVYSVGRNGESDGGRPFEQFGGPDDISIAHLALDEKFGHAARTEEADDSDMVSIELPDSMESGDSGATQIGEQESNP